MEMKSSRLFVALMVTITLLYAAAAGAAGSIDMNDPRRVVGRENDIRVDALLIQDTVSPGSTLGLRYQIQNLTTTSIAIADRVAVASYDRESATIILSVGSEIPPSERMPRLEVIGPGQTRVFSAGATPQLMTAGLKGRRDAAPRFVQVNVSLLRDLVPFDQLIAAQDQRGGQQFPEELFDEWFESQDTIRLNAIPVHFAPGRPNGDASSSTRADASGGY
jgi:hypothetical protein